MSNQLINESSPYLLQHANNPVNWYPWCDAAFAKAKAEDKPVFLSIGYSTCHWCHVMAHESFENEEIAEILNTFFVSIKVDREERPDIDSVYMSICQAFTGSGGWPTSIFMTAEQKPFFAGTYFPREKNYGTIGFQDLLLFFVDKWKNDKDMLLKPSEKVVETLKQNGSSKKKLDNSLPEQAARQYRQSYDEEYGGFGNAPKFPSPHNLIFLMKYYEETGKKDVLEMVEHTLLQMYRGGLFDHVGYGFSRYSTDAFFLVPHFEKMLYDNALLLLAYCKAFEITNNDLFLLVAEKIATYVMREMLSEYGGFYCAQDADSEGVEGKYYIFSPREIICLLGEETGKKFNTYYDITEKGNFEGKNIPNLLKVNVFNNDLEQYLERVYEYRKGRHTLHLDDKILTSWNGLMIAALCELYRLTQNQIYIDIAIETERFLAEQLCEDKKIFVSYRKEVRGALGVLDDYANYIFALLILYSVTFDKRYLERAEAFCNQTIEEFWDMENSGFYLYGKNQEELILHPKDMYDGALPSGNSVMTWNLVRLNLLLENERYEEILEKQIAFCSGEAEDYPTAHAMFLIALQDYLNPPDKMIVVVKGGQEEKLQKKSVFQTTSNCVVKVLWEQTKEYQLVNDKTTYYICKNHTCMPPVNEISIE